MVGLISRDHVQHGHCAAVRIRTARRDGQTRADQRHLAAVHAATAAPGDELYMVCVMPHLGGAVDGTSVMPFLFDHCVEVATKEASLPRELPSHTSLFSVRHADHRRMCARVYRGHCHDI